MSNSAFKNEIREELGVKRFHILRHTIDGYCIIHEKYIVTKSKIDHHNLI